MNPNEGHGQGDAVIQDFLEAAYYASDSAIWDNKKFFQIWTPRQNMNNQLWCRIHYP
jgi:hypothetical protein